MCVIYCGADASSLPSDREMEQGAKRNDDGAGVAYLKNKQIHWVKGLDSNVDHVKKVLHDNKVKGPYAIHFRTASIGGKLEELTHPFPVTPNVEDWLAGRTSVMLMHNGHIHDWEKHFLATMYNNNGLCPEGEWSDSRALAYIVAMKGPGVVNFIRGQSRVLLFSASPYSNPEDGDCPHFRMFGSWIWEKSTKHWQSVSTTPQSTKTPGKASGAIVATSSKSGGTTCGVNNDRCVVYAWSRGNDTTNNTKNVWTIDEIARVVESLEKEQEDAKSTLGIH